VVKQKHKKYQIKNQSTSIFNNFSKVEKMKKNHKKRLLKCRKWHFLENLSLDTGKVVFDKVGNQIPPQMHIK